ncbi:MAG: hypothetical protein ACI9BV_003711, partial [Rhodothermales bacterium]
MSRSLYTRYLCRFVALLTLVASSAGTSASSALSVAQAPPTFSVAFSPTTVAPGVSSTLTFTINNSAETTAVSFLTFSNTLPAGMTVSSPSGLTTTCVFRGAGGVTATAGSNSILLSDGSLGLGESCTISVSVQSSTVGAHVNTTGALSTSAGSAGTANATLTVDGARPTFSKAFSPSTILPGDASTLTFTIDNSANGSNFIRGRFTDTFPSGMVVAPVSNVSTTCTGVLAASAGATSVSFSSGWTTVGFGATCTVQVDVTVPVVGTYTNTSSDLTSNGSNPSGSATAVLEVAVTNFVSQSFGQQALPGASETLTFTINNTWGGDATGITFTNDLNATLSGLSATVVPANDFCGTGSTLTGSSNLTVANASLLSGASCSFDVTVLVPTGAASGSYTNTTSTVNASISGSGEGGRSGGSGATTFPASTSTLSVVKGVILSKTFIDDPVTPGSDVTVRYVLTNTDASNALSAISFTDDINRPSLSGTVAKTVPSANSCGTGSTFTTSTADGNLLYFAVSGANLAAGANCTFDLILTTSSGLGPGSFAAPTSVVTATNSGTSVSSPAATDNLTVLSVPNVSKVFSPTSAASGDTATLQFTISNDGEGADTATGLTFTDDLNAALTGLVSTTATQADICGTGSSLSGTSSLTFSGGTLAADATCTFAVTVQIPAGAVPGTYMSTNSAMDGTVNASSISAPAASAVLTITGLSFSHTFENDPYAQGQTATLRYTIANSASGLTASDISFDHELHRLLSTLYAIPGSLPPTPCGGGSAVSGVTTLNMSGGTLAPGASCTFDVPILIPAGAADGDYASATTAMSATVNGVSTATPASSDVLSVAYPVSVSLEFTDDPVAPGGSATLQFVITGATNIGQLVDLTSLTGLVATDLPKTVCSTGNLTGTSIISLAATISDSCTFTVALSVPAGATLGSTHTFSVPANVMDAVVDGNLKNAAASATLEISSVATGTSPAFSQAFSPNPAVAGVTSTITFTVDNTGSTTASAKALRFVDTFPAGLVVAAAPNASTTCTDGTLTAVAAAGSITYADGTVGAAATCLITVDVVAAATGDYTNTSGSLTSSLGDSGTSTATLRVNAPPVFTKAFSPDPGTEGSAITLTFTVNNTASTASGTSLAFTDTLPTGLVVATTPNPTATCSAGTMTAVAGASAITYTGGTVSAAATCLITV